MTQRYLLGQSQRRVLGIQSKASVYAGEAPTQQSTVLVSTEKEAQPSSPASSFIGTLRTIELEELQPWLFAVTLGATGNTDLAGGYLAADVVKIHDDDDSHELSFVWNESEATANRTLNFLVHGGNRSLNLYESLTLGDGNDGTLTYSAASKTLTVEDNAVVSQDYSSDASPTFANVIVAAGGSIGVADNVPIILFDDTNNYLEIYGNVGIGMADPRAALQVEKLNNGGESLPLIVSNDGADNGTAAGIDFRPVQNTSSTKGKIVSTRNSGNDYDMKFYTFNSGGLFEALELDLNGTGTFGGNIIIQDAGNIGSASDTDAIAIASGGEVTLSQTLILSDVVGAGADTDKFLVLDGSNNVDYRTGAEVLSDIGGAVASHAMSTHSDEDTYNINTSGTLTAGNATLGTVGCGAITTSGTLTFSGANPDIIGGDTDGILSITADTATNQGGSIKLYGNTHATLAQDIEFYADATKVLEWDESEGNWDFNSQNVKGIGTIDSGIITCDGIVLDEDDTAGTSGLYFTFDDSGNVVTLTGGGLTIAGNLALAANSITGTSVDINNAELQQLSNIGAATISSTQWGYLGACGAGGGQILANLTTGESTQLEAIGAVTITNTQWGYLGSSTAAGGAVLDAADDAAILALLSGDAGAAFSWNSQNLTSVGTIGCGTITIADGSSLSLQEDITFTGATTVNLIKFPDNLADALSFEEATNSYMKFITTNNSEAVQFGKNVGINVAPTVPLQVAGQVLIQDSTVETTTGYKGMYIYFSKKSGATGEEDDFFGFDSVMNMNDADSTVGHVRGGRCAATLTSGTIGDGQEHLMGFLGTAAQYGGTINGGIRGFVMTVDMDAGTLNGNAYGGYVQVDIESGFTAINGSVYGLYLWVDVDKDPTGTVYMLYLDEQNAANTDYGIYQSGTGANRLGGNLDIAIHNAATAGLKLGGTLVTASAAELNYSDGVTSAIQTQLDARCLESVFGTSISTGLLLDGTALKASAILQKYHGIDPSANVQSLLGAANYAAMLALLTAQAGAAFDWGGQNLTNLGTLTAGANTLTIDETKSLSDKMEDVVDDASPQLGGDLEYNEKHHTFNTTLTSDNTASGDIITVTFGESVVFGQLVYADGTDDEWKLALATNVAVRHPALGVALESKGNGQTGKVLLRGLIRDATFFSGFALGDMLYLSDGAAGSWLNAAPTDSGDIVQIVGWVLAANYGYFNPCHTYIELV